MENSSENLKYLRAQRRLKQLKGFYIHLAVYLVINPAIIFANSKKLGFTDLMTYSTAILWGLVIIIHLVSVFFFRKWEENKMDELMKKINETDNGK
ncbi:MULTISPECIES: 2TM domain-containing protein [Chryseobacterium]|uniref:2TM domain-containing protein n=1 Tax=Chryseobacterium sp. R2A-55 TaxID=2744445 RepID=UPI001F415C3C|nr:2TM domain-containing protein [Chryseobacterium sp. R2A-55]